MLPYGLAFRSLQTDKYVHTTFCLSVHQSIHIWIWGGFYFITVFVVVVVGEAFNGGRPLSVDVLPREGAPRWGGGEPRVQRGVELRRERHQACRSEGAAVLWRELLWSWTCSSLSLVQGLRGCRF